MSFTPPARQRNKPSERDLPPERIQAFADERWTDFPGVKPGGYAIPPGPIAPLPDLFPPIVPPHLLPLDPPAMPFTAAPPTFPAEKLGHVTWFNTMFADLGREHAQVQQLKKDCTETIGVTHRGSSIALAEFAQEAERMQGFLNMVGATAGRRVVKEILQGVEEQVDGWFHGGPEEGEEEEEDIGP